MGVHACWTWLAIAAAGTTAAAPRLDQYPGFASRYVPPRQVTVWLPDGYSGHGRRFPVIYMADGQNLFDASMAFGGESWAVADAMARRAARGAPVAIVVGVWNTPLRFREYMPQKLFGLLDADLRGRVAASHGGEPLSDAYLRFLVKELKPFVDDHYRTLPGRSDTSIMGSSMGGLISLYALAEYPRVYGQAACLSIHWPLLRIEAPAVVKPTDVGEVAAAVRRYLAHARLQPGRNRLYYDRGDQTLDAMYPPYTAAIDALLPGLGWHAGSDWISRAYPGADHSEASWRSRLEIPLDFLLGDAGR
jgi:pimeloyl-ACP methyl ester carboxylesterase